MHVHARRRRVRALLGAAILGVAAALTAVAAPLVGAQGQAAPVNTALPTVSGTAQAGATLTLSSGSWTGAPTKYDYQWLRCDSAGSACAEIAGADGTTYQATNADVGRRLRGRVAAINGDGGSTATSAATATIAAAPNSGPPVNVKAPSISGTPQVGQQLRAAPGDWSGAQPISVTFQWLRCDTAGNNCGTISGATDDAHRPTDADQGKTLRTRITASNSAGTASQLTGATAVIAAPAGPAGAIRLSTGETSIPASSVPADERLIVDQAVFTPNVLRSRTGTFTVKVKVKDTRGYVVRDVLVFVRSTPLVTQRAEGRDTVTAQDGWTTVTMIPERDFPQLNPAYSVQFYVKAYRQGDRELGGIAGTRLVQVPLGR